MCTLDLRTVYNGPIKLFHNRGDDLDGLHTALAAVVAGIAVVLAAFIFHPPTEICRGHRPFPEDVLNQYGFAIAELHFTRARMPIVAAHCTLQLVSGPQTTPHRLRGRLAGDRTGARWCRSRRRRRLARVALPAPQLGPNKLGGANAVCDAPACRPRGTECRHPNLTTRRSPV